MADFEILIKTEGASAAASEFDKTASAIKKTTEATKSATEATEQHHSSSRKLFSGIKELGREVPLLGAAFHLLHNPLVAISIIGVGLVKIVKELNAAYKESADAINESAKKVSDSSLKYRDAAQAAEELARAQETSKKAADLATEAFKEQNEQLDLQFKLDSDLLEAQKQLALAKATTPEQKAAIEDRFGQAGLALELRRSENKGFLIDDAIAAEQAKQFEAKAQLPDTNALQIALGKAQLATAKVTNAQIENRESFLDVEAIKGATGNTPALPGQFARAVNLEFEHGSLAAARAASKARSEKAREEFEAARREQSTAFADLPPGVGDQAGLDAFVEGKTGAVNADINRSGARITDLRKQGQREFLQRGGRAQVGVVQQQARTAQATTDQQQAQAAAAQQLLQDLGLGHKINLDLLRSMLQESAAFRKEIEQLKNQQRNNK